MKIPPHSLEAEKVYIKSCRYCDINFSTNYYCGVFCSKVCQRKYSNSKEAIQMRSKRRKNPEKYPLFEDLTGMRSGFLTAKTMIRKNGRIYWICSCDCGGSVDVRSDAIKDKKIKSCGCLKKSQRRPYKASVDILYCQYKLRAKSKKIEFGFSKSLFAKYLNGRCHYCGSMSSNIYKINYCDNEYTFKYNGIDRVDNSIGYIESNCVSCCDRCNKAKFTGSASDFIEWLKRASDYASKNH